MGFALFFFPWILGNFVLPCGTFKVIALALTNDADVEIERTSEIQK